MLRFPFIESEKHRRKFLQARRGQEVSDTDFLQAIEGVDSPAGRRMGLAVRRAIALECGIPSEKLFPNDLTVELERLMGGSGFFGWLFFDVYGFDLQRFDAFLLRELGRDAPDWDRICRLPPFAKTDSSGVHRPQPVSKWISEAVRVLLDLA